MGKVFAFRAEDGKPLWERSVGRHENDTGPLPDEFVNVYPGALGGVETPMALADGRLFVPWVDWAKPFSSTASIYDPSALIDGRGGLAAINAATGNVLWQTGQADPPLPQMPLGAATVANDVVFTSTYSGHIYAFDTSTGQTLWTDRARAGINAFPALDGDMLLVGAGAGPSLFSGLPEIFPDPVVPELVAYQLSG
jgi:alcohol dehydrogenase (cytochrome c)